jgi:peptidoglycan/LPS O-acetylase OafA/YrhL
MLVVLSHAGLGSVVPGGSGVTIFFSISGFIITYLMLRERDARGGFAIRHFYLRRALKIGPPFLLVVLLPTAVYAIVHGVAAGQVAGQAFFSFNWVQAHLGAAPPSVLPGSGVVWSLAIEEQFYLIFAVLWLALLARSARPVRAVTVLCLLVLLASNGMRLWLAHDPANTWRIFYGTDTRLDGIALGALTALAYHRWTHDPEWAPRARRALTSPWTVPLAALAYLASLAIRDPWFRDTVHFLIQSAATCAVILWGLLAIRTPATRHFDSATNVRAVQAVGLASYSIYLVHDELIELLTPALGTAPLPVRVAVYVIVGVGAGLLIYRLVEIPAATLRARLHR